MCFTAIQQLCKFILLQEVRIYKSCGVFISFVLIFEHYNFVDNCRLMGKIGPDMSTKKFLNDNSPIYLYQSGLEINITKGEAEGYGQS